MKKILWLTYYKVIPYRIFWISLSLFLAVFLLGIGVMSVFTGGAGMGATLSPLLQRPYIWGNLCWVGQVGHFILSFLLVMLVVNDYEQGTLRKQVMDGASRNMMLGHYAFLGVLLSFMALTVVLFAGLFFGEKGSSPFGTWVQLGIMGRFFLEGVSLHAATLFAILLVRKSVPAILFLSLWQVCLEPLLGLALNHYVHDGISSYLPFHALSNLIPAPHLTFVGVSDSDPLSWIEWLVSLGYTGIFYLGSWLRLKYQDL